MNRKKNVILEKYKNTELLTEEEKKAIKREHPWEHYVLDDFIEYKPLKRMQKTFLSKKHKFPTQENDLTYVQTTLLTYMPLARVFYSIEFKSLLEILSNTSLSLNTSYLVQLARISQLTPVFPRHVDSTETRSLIALYYLSPNWIKEVGGQLCLHSNEFEDESQAVLINPIENRLIFFFSDNTNWHSIRKVNNWDRYTVLSQWIVQNPK